MHVRRISFAALAALMAAVSACTVAPIGSPTATPNAALTGTATAASTSTPAGVPVTGATATSTPPMVSVTSATNCRTGPSTAYALVLTANPGQEYTILGVFTGGNYWIIQNPLGGSCWLWGQNAVVTGNTASLPAYPAPSLASNEIEPAAPTVVVIGTVPSGLSNLSGSRTCQSGTRGTSPIWIETVTLTWTASTDQNGYNVFKGNTQIATLASNATSFSTVIRYLKTVGSPMFDTFGVQAFNGFGTSSRPSIDVVRCP